MDKRTSLLLGSLFVISSGFIYALERINSHVYWLGQVLAKINGSFPIKPDMPGITENWFVILFLALGLIFYIGAWKK